MLRPLLASLALGFGCLCAPVTLAQSQITQTDMAGLGNLLQIDSLIAVMSAEGRANGGDMAADIFTGQGGDAWQAVVDRVYDTADLRRLFDTGLNRALAGDTATISAMTEFFGSDLGQRVLRLEVSARRALLEDATVDAASTDKPRAARIERFAKANDLIDSNVVGSLNANLAFYRGMADGGAFDPPMAEQDMLAEVWSQEANVRADTIDWLYPFLALAYQPLTNNELDRYIAFSESAGGAKANAAIFQAFDSMFVAISKELGRSAARLMAGQDI
jgi:hypothetical protein